MDTKSNADDLPDVVSITTDRLALILTQHEQRTARAGDWKTPLSIAVTLWLILPVTDFKDRLGLAAGEWRIVVVMLAIVSTIWCGLESFKRLSYGKNETSLLSAIAESSDRLDDHRGLFFFHAEDESRAQRILVYFDEVWGCYLLPHVDVQGWDLSDVAHDGPLAAYGARLVGADSRNVTVKLMRSVRFRSTKYSQFARREKSYTFEFFHVIVAKSRSELSHERFSSGGRLYHWKTLTSLLQHEETRLRNSDVLHHIEGHFAEFYHQTPRSIQSKVRATNPGVNS